MSPAPFVDEADRHLEAIHRMAYSNDFRSTAVAAAKRLQKWAPLLDELTAVLPHIDDNTYRAAREAAGLPVRTATDMAGIAGRATS